MCIRDWFADNMTVVGLITDGDEIAYWEEVRDVHITKDLTWSTHTCTVMKRARPHHFSLRRLQRFGMGPQILKEIYSYHQEHLDWLHHHLVWQMHHPRLQIDTEGGSDSPEHHWG